MRTQIIPSNPEARGQQQKQAPCAPSFFPFLFSSTFCLLLLSAPRFWIGRYYLDSCASIMLSIDVYAAPFESSISSAMSLLSAMISVPGDFACGKNNASSAGSCAGHLPNLVALCCAFFFCVSYDAFRLWKNPRSLSSLVTAIKGLCSTFRSL